MAIIPENLRTYASFKAGNAVTDLLGIDIQASDIDVANFGEDQKEVLRQTVSNARADGRNYITYEDYPPMATGDKPHEYYRGAREERSNLDLIRESFSDPVFEMFTTLGVFNFKDQPDGGFEILADAYDFNASKSPKNSVAMDSYSQAVYDAQDIGDQSYRFNVSGIVL